MKMFTSFGLVIMPIGFVALVYVLVAYLPRALR